VSTTTLDLAREARRLCQRYVDEVVLRFDLCPWAAPALRDGRVEMSVITDQISDLAVHGPAAAQKVFETLNHLERDARVELALVLLPRFELGRLELDAFQRMVRAHQERGEAGFALAAFHPEAAPDLSDPERLIPFLRRSPDPMLQAVRSSVLDRIDPSRGAGTQFMDLDQVLKSGLLSEAGLEKSPPEPLRRRVARANQKTLEHHGIDAFERALGDIIEDRARTYRTLGNQSD
jgi:hypothetical protein